MDKRFGKVRVPDSTLFAAASFEERSLVITRNFLAEEGQPRDVHLANVIEHDRRHRINVAQFQTLGLDKISELNRFSSRDLWSWTWQAVRSASPGNAIIDITCFPRELLGMVLFAISLMRKKFASISVRYIAAPADGYATQNPALEESEQWLSKGVSTIRSIVGFPGAFSGEKVGHLIALVGHEYDRLLEIIEYLEPSRLSISSERKMSSTSSGAGNYSSRVAKELRTKIEVPKLGNIVYGSDSIREVYESLEKFGIDFDKENVGLAAMNTKLSFVGAALYALKERRIRMVYAVPNEYNPLYCQGVGEFFQFDITELINRASTEIVN